MQITRLNLMFLLIIGLVFTNNSLKSQIFIDTVYSVSFGSGQNFGRSPEFFPQNIFGAPSVKATKYTPVASEEELCSLGLGGEIVVGAKNHLIVNKPGVDFIIFENVFSNSADTKIFVEPAIISVSKDGENFIEFPFDSETFSGLAGIRWTNGGENPFDIAISGGDGFDLEDVGIDSIKYIKIKDTALIASTIDKKHKYYSPAATLSGFDLDAVALVHVEAITSDICSNTNLNNNILITQITQTDDKISCISKNISNIMLLDILGNKLLELKNTTTVILDKNKLSTGIYFLLLEDKTNNTCCSKTIYIY